MTTDPTAKDPTYNTVSLKSYFHVRHSILVYESMCCDVCQRWNFRIPHISEHTHLADTWLHMTYKTFLLKTSIQVGIFLHSRKCILQADFFLSAPSPYLTPDMTAFGDWISEGWQSHWGNKTSVFVRSSRARRIPSSMWEPGKRVMSKPGVSPSWAHQAAALVCGLAASGTWEMNSHC